MEEFEQQLRQAFVRQPAPPGLKQRLMEERNRQRVVRLRHREAVWHRLAAGMVLAVALGGGLLWRQHEERRKGEEAREQVLTALRITSQALDTVQMRLAEHDARAQRRAR
jgi:hypothetical protein